MCIMRLDNCWFSVTDMTVSLIWSSVFAVWRRLPLCPEQGKRCCFKMMHRKTTFFKISTPFLFLLSLTSSVLWPCLTLINLIPALLSLMAKVCVDDPQFRVVIICLTRGADQHMWINHAPYRWSKGTASDLSHTRIWVMSFNVRNELQVQEYLCQ